MASWKIVMDESAFQFFVSSRAAERRKLLSAFDELRADPQRQADYHTKDPTGRVLSVWGNRPFLIVYWLDAFVSEIRILDIQRVRF
ncbi:MAG: hypothetical protein WCL11_01825 [Verrucomicrobiota bacterium]|nr:hypothetical protein [Verrucomicrobiota bacterium]